MLFLIGLFIVLNGLCVISTGYIMFLVLRMMTAIVTGVLISLAMIVASESMPIIKRGLAISFVFGGFTMANVMLGFQLARSSLVGSAGRPHSY
jgi:predicted MFS family arabinose efflux permease